MGKGTLLTVAFVVACLGATIGIFLMPRQPMPQVVIAPPKPTAPAQNTKSSGVVQGGTYTTANIDRLWTDDAGMTLWKRAVSDRDTTAQQTISSQYENFVIQPGTRVRVVVSFDSVLTLKRLEVLSGPDTGRRGWTDTYPDAQYIP